MGLFRQMSSGLRFVSLVGVGCVVFLTILFGTPLLLGIQKKNSPSQSTLRQLAPTIATTPAGENITSSQTISLAGGGVTFEVPNDLKTHQADEPMPTDNPTFDRINLISPIDTKTLSQSRPGDSSTKDYARVMIEVSRGWYPSSQQTLSFNSIHSAHSTKDRIVASDTSVLPVNSPFIATDNTRVTVLEYPVTGNPKTFEYIVELHTNSQYTDGQTYQAQLDIRCDNQLLNPSTRCRDIVKQILSTFQIHEPLSTDISSITYNGSK